MKYIIINVSDHGGYDCEEGWVTSMAPDEEGWGPFDSIKQAKEAEQALLLSWPTYKDRGYVRRCDHDLRIISIKLPEGTPSPDKETGVFWCPVHYGIVEADENECDSASDDEQECDIRPMFYRTE